MNRNTAPEISGIKDLKTGFPSADGSLFHFHAEEGVFKLEMIFPGSGYGIYPEKFSSLFAMDLILSGTPDKSAHEISEALDSLGAYVFKSSDYYNSSVTLFGLNDKLGDILALVKDAVEQCHFDLNELNIYKNKKISELNINLGKTAFLSNRRINQMLFGLEHPFAETSDPEKIRSVSPEHLTAFKNKALQTPYFIFTGPAGTDIAGVLATYGYRTDVARINSAEDPMPVSSEADWFVKKSGATQNSLRIGKILPSRSHPDYFTLNIFNLILGGYFGSRLMKNIREEKGLTYGIHSGITPFKNYSLFRISSECNAKLTETVKTEIEKEIQVLQNDLIDIEELTIAKNYLSGAMLRNFDGAFNISERFKSFLDLDTPEDYYNRYFRAIHAVTPEDIRNCANNYFAADTLRYCVSGEM